MSEAARVLKSIGFSEPDTAVTARYRDQTTNLLPNLIDGFYEHLFATGQGTLFRGVDVARLKARQVAHWEKLFEARLDTAYVNDVTRIGIVHRDREIVPKVYMQAYGWFTAHLSEAILAHPGVAAEDRPALVSAVLKLLFLDMTLALASYDAALVD